MKPLVSLLAAAVLLTGPLASRPTIAETVHFRSATTPPTPLQARLARERGQPVAEQPSTELVGELYRPTGNGPFPAVVSLHGCGGRGPRASEDASGARFVALGYALLIVDSFSPRGVKEYCSTAWKAPVDRLMDAYGALLYLAGLPFIDADRIALVDYSQGGWVALSAVKLRDVEALFDRHFRAAVAYYPPCDISLGAVSVPTLVLAGELDDWALARDCQAMVARRNGEGAPMRLVVYPGAHHAFDAASVRDEPRTYFGHGLEYNEAADQAAWTETLAALKDAFRR
jgi:dienelactone hydrolase